MLYGRIELEEPVLMELIDSSPVQRLKRINQFGMPQEFYFLCGFNRYEHSVGVMLLLKKLGAGLEEQVAGLLHDVSHTAFSHVIDWVIGDPVNEDFQDRILKDVIHKSDVPKILSRFGFDAEEIIDMGRYHLLEDKIPNLCADRVDYALREFYYWSNKSAVKPCMNGLRVYKGRMVFFDKRTAELFARNYLKLQNEHWGSANACVRYYLLSRALKIGLKAGVISTKDFYSDDHAVIEKLMGAKNDEIDLIFKELSQGPRFELTEHNPQISMRKKFRYVDPKYLDDGELCRLSKEDPGYNEFLRESKRMNEKGVSVNLLPRT